MATLSTQDRQRLRAEYSAEVSGLREALGVSKTDLLSAINAIDQWVDDNAVAFNSALPQPARGALTARQKAHLLTYVVRRRFEVQ